MWKAVVLPGQGRNISRCSLVGGSQGVSHWREVWDNPSPRPSCIYFYFPWGDVFLYCGPPPWCNSSSEAHTPPASWLRWNSKTNLSALELDHLRYFLTVTGSKDSSDFSLLLPAFLLLQTLEYLSIVIIFAVNSWFTSEEVYVQSHIFSSVGMSRGMQWWVVLSLCYHHIQM